MRQQKADWCKHAVKTKIVQKLRVDYLGHHIGLGSVQLRIKKVEALLSFPRPGYV